jgi:hypothetical protein
LAEVAEPGTYVDAPSLVTFGRLLDNPFSKTMARIQASTAGQRRRRSEIAKGSPEAPGFPARMPLFQASHTSAPGRFDAMQSPLRSRRSRARSADRARLAEF